MSAQVAARDVLLYVDSHSIVRVLPPDAQDECVRGLQAQGFYTFARGPFLTGTGGFSGSTVFDAHRFGSKPVRGTELSPDEQKVVQDVWKQAHAQGRNLHIVDVGKESELHRYIQEHRRHLRRFPVLVRPDGRRLEGVEAFTPENLAHFFTD